MADDKHHYPSLKTDPAARTRVDALDAWLRERFPGRRIARADHVLLAEGLRRLRTGPAKEADAARFFRWLEKQPPDTWATVVPAGTAR
jgi:hypothetical protein